jgi:hypothetical protein
MKAKTYCDFNQIGRADVICNHRNLQTARRQFKRIIPIWHGIHKWRVWTVASNGKIICDTGKK